jgi:hypothetical protein
VVAIDRFIADGFVRIDKAFPREIAEAARAILLRDTGCEPDRPETWTPPVIRLDDYPGGPFAAAVNTPILHEAFDALVGPAVGCGARASAPSPTSAPRAAPC